MAMTASFVDEYLTHLQRELARHRAELQKWESGTQKVSRRAENGAWEDMTPQWIESDKAAIAVYEDLIRKLENGGIGKIPVYSTRPV